MRPSSGRALQLVFQLEREVGEMEATYSMTDVASERLHTSASVPTGP